MWVNRACDAVGRRIRLHLLVADMLDQAAVPKALNNGQIMIVGKSINVQNVHDLPFGHAQSVYMDFLSLSTLRIDSRQILLLANRCLMR